MTIITNATFENGVPRRKEPLKLVNETEVEITINTRENVDPLENVIGIGDGPPDGAENHDKYLYGRLRP